MKKRNYLSLMVLALLYNTGQAQNLVVTKYGKGINFIAVDSSMSLKLGARFQTLFVAGRSTADGADYERNMQIRRARLKFDGFVFSPKVEYKIELSLSNRDNAPANVKQMGNASSIVLDAVLKYELRKNLHVWFGQTKLPGNRERVISSSALQFVDRSMLNGKYNIDRDLGIQLHHSFKIGDMVIKDIYALTMGEGRNVVVTDTGGLCHTVRVEVLPFGAFTNKGDYFDADLAREEKPKLSLGAGYNFTNDAVRKGGQLGDFLTETRDLNTFFADVMIKYQGWSLTSEYMNKKADRNPLLKSRKNFFETGEGWNIQSGYLFKNNVELAARYTTIKPSSEIINASLNEEEKEYTVGLSKYFSGHNLKIQTDFSLIEEKGATDKEARFRFQVELAF